MVLARADAVRLVWFDDVDQTAFFANVGELAAAFVNDKSRNVQN